MNLRLLLRSQLERSTVDKALDCRELVQKQYIFILFIKINVVKIWVQNLWVHEVAATLGGFQIENSTKKLEEILDNVITGLSVSEQKIVFLLFEHNSESRLLVGNSLVVDHI